MLRLICGSFYSTYAQTCLNIGIIHVLNVNISQVTGYVSETFVFGCVKVCLNFLTASLQNTFFQYSSFIIKLFEMISDTVYLGTCIRRLNMEKFDSIRMFIYAKR